MITGTSTIALADVIVKDRIRADLGDIEELAESIAREGLLQPIVIDDQNRLVAGGRRYTAFTLLNSNKVACENPDLYARVPYVRLGQLSPSRKVMLELEENWRRKAMTWQENVIGIAMYHKAAVSNARAEGDSWSQQLTGKLLGMNQAKVSVALTIAKHIQRAPTGPIAKAENLTQAVEILAKLTLDKATAERAARFKAKQAVVPSPTSCSVPSNSASDTGCLPNTSGAAAPIYRPSIISQLSNELGAGLAATAGAKSPLVPKEALVNFYAHIGDCLDYIRNYAASGKIKFNHIITDPPYGIDMANLDTDASIERVRETHEVVSNLELLREFLRLSYDVIAEDGFLCLWYDLDHHEKLLTWAREVGWRPCKWPLVWCKTSSCVNSQAQYNITKATEVCMFLRRSEKSVLRKKGTVNWFTAHADSSGTHPFVKPFEAWKRVIELVSDEGQTILDPFAGEGSCLYSAFKLGRLPAGIEIDEKHANLGVDFMFEKLNASANPLQGLL